MLGPSGALDELTALKSLESAAEHWGERVKNPSALYLAEDGRGVAVLPDPLGGAIVFIWRSPTATYVSSSIPALVAAAEHRGDRPRKSLEYQVERSLVGNGGLLPASYEGFEALEMATWAMVTEAGVEARSYASFEDDLDYSGSYFELLAQARADIMESVTAIAGLEVDKHISHLTGGFDSRLTLAAIRAAGLTDRFQFFTSGPVGTPDRDVSDLLSGHYGLTRTNDAGLSTYPVAGVRETFLGPMRNSGGITSSGPTGRETPFEVAAVGGGYGGLLRSTHSRLLPEVFTGPLQSPGNGKGLCESLWGPNVLAEDGLASPDAIARLRERTTENFTQLRGLGAADDQLGDLHYTSGRNRYHFGQNSVLWSRYGYRFDPLYSRAGARISRMLPLGPRSANVVGFDLLTAFSEELAGLPFDKPRFTGEFARYRRVPPARSYRAGDFTTHRHEARYPAPVSEPVSESDREKFVAQSKRFGVNYWQVSQMAETQQGLQEALANIDATDLAGSLNLDYVRRLSKYRPRNRAEIRHLYSVYSMLLWYFEG
ncbi:hypothetical protein BJH93_08865 [Kocuria polaris]|nr:hypothetical protein [Kocuria polaris]